MMKLSPTSKRRRLLVCQVSKSALVTILSLTLLTGATAPWSMLIFLKQQGILKAQNWTLKQSVSVAPPKDSPLHHFPQLLVEPWDIVDQYMEWHSQQALAQETTTNITTNGRRSYAIAFYSCPLQIGNRWHHFMNTFLWSILTNRTLLWKYWDRETCLQYGAPYDGRICSSANRVQDCNVHLRREEWIPSYQEWSQHKKHVPIKKLSFWATHSPKARPGRGFLPYHQSTRDIEAQLGLDARHHQWPVVVFPQMLDQSHSLGRQEIREYLLETKWAQQTARVLFQYGADFLYGLLFHSAFGLTQELVDNTTAMVLPNKNFVENNTKTSIVAEEETAAELFQFSNCSIAIHSRHANQTTLGDNIKGEVKCLEKLWKMHSNNNPTTTTRECDLFVLADRPRTIQSLVEWCLEQRPYSSRNGFPCRRVLFADHETGRSFVAEHGPYAGVGFLQDLAVVRQSALTSIGVVGSKRSSTNLLVEWMEYDRFVDYYDNGEANKTKGDEKAVRERPFPELPKCIL